MDIVKLYITYIQMFFKSRAEYKVSFFTGIFANFYCYFITYATFWVITQRFSSIGGWSFSQISVLYSLNLLTYALSGTLFWYSIYFLEKIITAGNLDRYLLRPMGVIPQLMCQGFGYTFIGQIIVSLFFMLSNIISMADRLTPIKIVYLLFSILGGVLLQGGAIIMIGALSFWVMRSTDIGQIIYYDIRSFVNYPLNIYPKFVKIILTYVFPWAFINYYPSIIILGKAESMQDIVLGILAPMVGMIFFYISIRVFKQGMKRYSGSGN